MPDLPHDLTGDKILQAGKIIREKDRPACPDGNGSTKSYKMKHFQGGRNR